MCEDQICMLFILMLFMIELYNWFSLINESIIQTSFANWTNWLFDSTQKNN